MHLRAAVHLLDWLTYQNLTLASCRQSDLERWMTRDETHVEVRDATVRIGLGDIAVTLPDPVAELALEQVSIRRSHAVLARTDSPWLFPGGQPGRPISAWAVGERLRKIGIRLAETRSTALFQLATEPPAAILTRTLGIHTTVAVTWQRAAAGDWGAYAADVSRRTTPQRT